MRKLKPSRPGGESDLPGMPGYEPDVVAAVVPVITGTTVAKDGERVERIVSDVLVGMSHSEICRRHRCAWSTVDQVMRIAEERGKIAGIKDRLLRRVSAAALMSWDRVNDDLSSGRSPDQSASITAGIATDKMGVLLGLNMSPAVTVQVGVSVSVDLVSELSALRSTASQADATKTESPAYIDISSPVLPTGTQSGTSGESPIEQNPPPGCHPPVMDGGGGDAISPGPTTTMDGPGHIKR
jgi:hypothetical protein